MLLVISVPFAITMYFENPVDLVKMSAFITTGSFFVMFSLAIAAEDNLKKGNNLSFSLNKSLDIPVFIFILAAVLSTIFSINPKISVFGQYQRQIGLITFVYLAVIYFLSSGMLQDKKRFTLLFSLAEITAVAVSLYSFIQISGNDPFGIQQPGVDRPGSTFGNAVFFGGFLALMFPFSALNISSKNNKIFKVLFPVIILGGIIVSGTRSAYIAVAAEIAVILVIYFLVIRNKKGIAEHPQNTGKYIKNILFITGGVLLILIVYMLIFPESFLSGRILSIFSSSNNPRLVLWQDSFGLFLKYPLTGTGIAMFSSAFEEFYSNRLRFLERTGYFDHPHNNYLYMLYSMGIIGLLAYMGILVQAARRCLINIFKREDLQEKIVFMGFAAFIAGYCVYGLTNFDDISILLYFFVFLAALKAADAEKTKEVFINRKITAIIVVPLILVCSFNIYSSINDMKADRFFKLGNNLIKQGKFAEAVYNMNTAIALNDYYTDYKYALANTVYRQVFSSETMPKETKMNLLNQSARQVEGLKNSHYFINESNALLSLIYYEMDREQEAKMLEGEVLKKDSVNITYRINLARYYIKKGDLNKAGELMNVVLELRPKSLDAYLTAAYLNFKQGNIEAAKNYCEQILIAEPGNQFAVKLLNDINAGKKP
jgi:O-antigen ligase/Tfp pilus assembly protein PilF